MNLRPSGYEPDELPGCSTPRQICRCDCPARLSSFRRGVCQSGYRSEREVRDLVDASWGAGFRNIRFANVLSLCGARILQMLLFLPGQGPQKYWSGGDLLSHVLRRSTIGAAGLNGRVRDGIGCFPRAITTRPAKGPIAPLQVWWAYGSGCAAVHGSYSGEARIARAISWSEAQSVCGANCQANRPTPAACTFGARGSFLAKPR